MERFLQALFEASVQGSILILVVLILRLLLKKLPRQVICILWLLAIVRLMLPLGIESRLSLQPQMKPVFSQHTDVNAEDTFQQAPDNIIIPDAVPDEPLDDVVISYYDHAVTDVQIRKFDYGSAAVWVWSIGAAGMMLYCVLSYLRLKRRVREAVLTEPGIYEASGLDTAFVLGYFRPRIYLPKGLEASVRALIVAHERAHISRLDHWYKLLGFLTLAVHWFNPLVWLCYVLLCRDIESACDASVVRDMDIRQRKAYSAALLSSAGHGSGIRACPVAFGEENVKKRIVDVLRYRKPGFWLTVAGIAVVVFIAVCFMTNPVQDQKEKAILDFYAEMERLQSSQNLELHVESQIESDHYVDEMQLDYFKLEDNWLRIYRYQTEEGSFTTEYMQVYGRQFACEHSEEIAGFINRDWEELSAGNLVQELPLLTRNWAELEVLDVRKETTGNVIIVLQGDLTPSETTTYKEKIYEVQLDPDGKLTEIVCKSSYRQYVDERNAQGYFDFDVTDTISFLEHQVTTIPIPQIIQDYYADMEGTSTNQQDPQKMIRLCRQAVEDFQALESVYVRENSTYISGGMAYDRTVFYYQSGTDWFRMSATASEQVQYLQKDGIQYRQLTTGSVYADNQAYLEWRKLESHEEALQDHWAAKMKWSDDSVRYLESGTYEENGNTILTVAFALEEQAAALPDEPGLKETEITLNFHIRESDNTLLYASKTVVGRNDVGQTVVSSSYLTVCDTVASRIRKTIDSHYAQVLGQEQERETVFRRCAKAQVELYGSVQSSPMHIQGIVRNDQENAYEFELYVTDEKAYMRQNDVNSAQIREYLAAAGENEFYSRGYATGDQDWIHSKWSQIEKKQLSSFVQQIDPAMLSAAESQLITAEAWTGMRFLIRTDEKTTWTLTYQFYSDGTIVIQRDVDDGVALGYISDIVTILPTPARDIVATIEYKLDQARQEKTQ